MFERYTEPARRVIFFGRFEASQYGSTTIETEHLLLGLIREDKSLFRRVLPDSVPVMSIRERINRQIEIAPKISTSIDLPLSEECKRILAYTAEEAETLKQTHIGTSHILLGILRENSCGAARVLSESGLDLKSVREEILRKPPLSAENLADAIISSLEHSTIAHTPLPSAGVVPDAETAKRIAVAVWLPRVSNVPDGRILVQNATLVFGVWLVTGSYAPDNNPITSLAAFIQKEDGKILRLHMEKLDS
jgi:hypothetical protein